MGACSHSPLFPPFHYFPFLSLPFLPSSPSLRSLSPSLALPLSSSLPLEVGPLNTARGLGSAVSSPRGVWGGV